VSLTGDEWAILDDNSDDWYGLWEVDWWFNAVHPDWPSKQRVAYLIDLVQRGLLEMFTGRAEDALLAQAAAIEALQNPPNWLPPTDDNQPTYHVSTTKAGVAALKA
jgi:hypothetical protein